MRGECEGAAAAMAEVWDGGSAGSAAADYEREEKGGGAKPCGLYRDAVIAAAASGHNGG
jgi:hypothetical protein